MEDKGWTDPRLFLEAFIKALEIHGTEHRFDFEKEWERANKAADELVADQEVSRRRRERSGGIGFIDASSLSEMEEELSQVLAEGFRAPAFPESCVPKLGADS